MNDLVIRPASKDEFAIAIEWAAEEGWNPGLGDLEVFHKVDPDGFLMGWQDGVPVSSISVVRYGEHFGFLGFYIVHSDYRGTGVGLATWNAGMAHLGNRTIGLDGVVDQQENYKRSGFIYAGRNVRFTGVPLIKTETMFEGAIRDFIPTDIDAILAYDKFCFPANREGFVRDWTVGGCAAHRKTKVALIDDELAGYATIRRCRSGYKVGPLFADNQQIAQGLFEQLCSGLPKDREVSLDVQQANTNGGDFAEQYGLRAVFETARMYRGPIEEPSSKTFGITTFELG
ncbi:MAG: GNAT family N-acetyltransferase [Hyphomicrobiales bacterium]|nr:MAG: GNAT family N-acetyltransferase [Hyphomicrobiales bacterium]